MYTSSRFRSEPNLAVFTNKKERNKEKTKLLLLHVRLDFHKKKQKPYMSP